MYENGPTKRAKAKRGRDLNKRGRKVESRVSKLIGAKANPSSQGWDSLLEDLNLKVEIKSREGTNKFWPTKEEWEKAIATDIDLLIITEQSGDKNARVCMTIDTLLTLIEYGTK